MSTYLTGIDTTIHPEDEMLLNAIAGLANEGLARAVYFRQGHEINSTLQTILDWSVGAEKSQAKVLDFACGYGRATRFLVAQVAPSHVWASDIYAGAVEFQKKQFGVNGFVSCYEPDALQCDVRFDLVFVASLFTHLPRDRFEQWLKRLFELLAPDGVLAFSVHDEALSGGRPVPEDGFLFVKESESRSLDEEEYGSTYVTEKYVGDAIGRAASPGWAFKRLPLALCGSHDMYVVSRNPARDLAALSYVQPPVGYVDWFSLSPEGVFRIGGWAGEHDARHSISNIAITINGRTVANVKSFFERADVAKALGKEQFTQSGWDFSLPGIDRQKQASQVVEVRLSSTTGKTAILHSSVLADAGPALLPPAKLAPSSAFARAVEAVKKAFA